MTTFIETFNCFQVWRNLVEFALCTFVSKKKKKKKKKKNEEKGGTVLYLNICNVVDVSLSTSGVFWNTSKVVQSANKNATTADDVEEYQASECQW